MYVSHEEKIGCPWRGDGVAVRAFAREAEPLAGNCCLVAGHRLRPSGEYRHPFKHHDAEVFARRNITAASAGPPESAALPATRKFRAPPMPSARRGPRPSEWSEYRSKPIPKRSARPP